MQRHDDGDALLLCHAAQNREQFQLVADIEERSRLVEDDDLRLLTDRTRKMHSLALAVADGVEIAAAELFGMNGAHRLLDLLLILAGQHAEPSGVRIAARCHDIVAGHQLRLHSLSKNYSHTGRQIPKGKGQQILVVKIDLSANDLQLSCNTF